MCDHRKRRRCANVIGEKVAEVPVERCNRLLAGKVSRAMSFGLIGEKEKTGVGSGDGGGGEGGGRGEFDDMASRYAIDDQAHKIQREHPRARPAAAHSPCLYLVCAVVAEKKR